MTEPIVFHGIEPAFEIQEEDVLLPRVVRHNRDIVVVLDNPRTGRNPKYVRNKFDEGETPNFVVTKSKGFQVYAKSEVSPNPNDNDGEPVFHGTLMTDRIGPPTYQIQIKL